MAASSKRRSRSCCEYEFTDSLCRLGEVLLAFSSGVLTMVTFGTPYWMVREPEEGEAAAGETVYHLGLWQNCTVVDTSVCHGLPLSAASVPGREKERVFLKYSFLKHTQTRTITHLLPSPHPSFPPPPSLPPLSLYSTLLSTLTQRIY